MLSSDGEETFCGRFLQEGYIRRVIKKGGPHRLKVMHLAMASRDD
jgi:hypothetical protein